MNNIVVNFDQILAFAAQLGVPTTKKRGILREFLQAKFISQLYRLPGSQNLSFVGGTSMRLLRNLNRFSEDLDFDSLNLVDEKIVSLVTETTKCFRQENIEVELVSKKREGKTFFELRFPFLLKQLAISTNPKEKLMVKVDYSCSWQDQKTEVLLMNHYGFLENIVTNTKNQLLVQKLTAFAKRKQVQPRALYDVVWLVSQGAKLDEQFMQINKLSGLVDEATARLANLKTGRALKNKLKPFLFDESQVDRLDLFESVLAKM